ncbi:hypothetical protein [Chitinophaga sp.]|uniref:hypothetical protein n=1 Tax=Chitinophaga sp. TaxID=1869181 RepID=UPI002F9260B5
MSKSFVVKLLVHVPLFCLTICVYAQHQKTDNNVTTVAIPMSDPATGENNSNIVAVLPSSPTAGDLGRAGLIKNNYSSGEVNVSIPLSEMSSRQLKFPVSLSYRTGGLKVDEISSRTGHNWVFSCGGVISRTVMGTPDEQAGTQLPPAFPTTSGQTLVNAMNAISNGSADPQPDIFSYNFAGYSGRFIYQNMQIFKLEQNNLLIAPSGFNSFVITAPDGVKYTFSAKESSTSVNNCLWSSYSRLKINNAWFLTTIQHPDGDLITIKYADCEFVYQAHKSQVFTYGLPSTENSCSASADFASCLITIRNYGVYPIQVYDAVGDTINLKYSPREDVTGDVRLDQLEIKNNGQVNKNFWFSYTYPSVSGSEATLAKRMYLLSIEEGKVKADPGNKKYAFQYTGLGSLPERLSNSQDYMGYYNGAYNANMIPKPSNQQVANAMASYGFANRSPNAEYAKIGSLNKVTYPTGGYDTIEYESNTVYDEDYSIAPNTYWNYFGEGGKIFKQMVTTESEYIPIYQNQRVSFSMTCNNETDTYPGEGYTKYYYILVDLLDETGAVVETLGRTEMDQSNSAEFNLVAGKSYKFRVKHFSQVSSELTLYYYPGLKLTERPMPGIRLKKIRRFDPLVNKESITRFYYNGVDNLQQSTGMAVNEEPNFFTSFTVKQCTGGNGCFFYRATSNSIYDFYSYSGQSIYYILVTEMYGDNGDGGAVTHEYNVSPDVTGSPVTGNDFFSYPLSNTGIFNGLEFSTRFYKKIDTSFVLTKSINNHYVDDQRLRRDSIFYAVSSVGGGFQACTPGTNTIVNDYINLAMASYTLYSRWLYIDTTVTTTYDDSGKSLTSQAVTYYGNAAHQQPTRLTSWASDGEKLEMEIKYPGDYPQGAADPVLTSAGITTDERTAIDKLNTFNIIEEPVYRANKRNSVTVSEQVNFPSIENGVNTVPHPGRIRQRQAQMPFEDRVRFILYDAKGNLLTQGKANDALHTYIWDYNARVPVCEVINAIYADIAYTSFETAAGGNWVLPASPTFGSGGITGAKFLSLGGAAISKSGLTAAKTYIISYWSNSEAAFTVNNVVKSTTGPVKNGWTYYEKEISGTTTVTLSGTGNLDELRLYPKEATMTSITYNPAVLISSQCDANGSIIYYQYDNMNRLAIVKDQDGKILKQFDYQYQQPINQ